MMYVPADNLQCQLQYVVCLYQLETFNHEEGLNPYESIQYIAKLGSRTAFQPQVPSYHVARDLDIL